MYFKNVVEKALNNSNLYIYRDLLIESGANINRIIHHFDSNNLCFITAYRNTNSKNKNELENKKLAMEIPSLGYDYLRLNGKYKEDGNDEFTDENSFMVIDDDLNEINQDNFFLNMLKLCKQYNQDSVLISLPNSKKYPIAIYDNNGKILYGPFSKMTIDKVSDFFSQIHNHKFIFESIFKKTKNKINNYNDAIGITSVKTKYKKMND